MEKPTMAQLSAEVEAMSHRLWQALNQPFTPENRHAIAELNSARTALMQQIMGDPRRGVGLAPLGENELDIGR